MDEAVDQVMGRSQDEKGADKAVALRRAQQKERARLQSEIAAEQKTVSILAEERAPIAAEIRKVEAEVGPIKYIAAFVYGDNTDANLLEKAVTWVIILIVIVFDPLAVIMLLAAQMTFGWLKEEKEKIKPAYEPDDGPLTDEQIDQIKESVDPHPAGWMFEKSSIVKNEPEVKDTVFDKHPYLLKPFDHFTNTTPIVAKSEPVLETDFPPAQDNEAAEEAAKWAQEQIDDSKKKTKYIIKQQNQQVKKTKE
jgi:hypothetical protein